MYNDIDPTTTLAAAAVTTASPAGAAADVTPASAATSTPAATTPLVLPSTQAAVQQASSTVSTSLVLSSSQAAVQQASSAVSQAAAQVAETSSTAGQVTFATSLTASTNAGQAEALSQAVNTQKVSSAAAAATIQTSSTQAAVSTEVAQTTSTSSSVNVRSSTSSTSPASTSTSAPITSAEQTTSTSSALETTTATSDSSSSSSSGSLSPPSVIVYSPYNNDGTCKDYDSVETDLKFIYSKGISKLRIYGADCATFTAVLPVAASLGMTVNQGLWISSEGVDSIDGYTSQLISYGEENGWDIFDFITVGNEAVNAGYVTVSELISKISSVKSQLNDAGYSGLITTSEPPATFISSPELCTESDIDFVGINPHSYFNENLYAYESGAYVTAQKSQVEEICSKLAFITETGYPSQGDTNGNNVPSAENQYIAIKSIIDSTGGDVTILTTYNDFWKEPGPYGIEQYFGTIQLYS